MTNRRRALLALIALVACVSTAFSQPAALLPLRMREAVVAARFCAKTAMPSLPWRRDSWASYLLPVPSKRLARPAYLHIALRRGMRAPVTPVIPTPRRTPAYDYTFRVLMAHPDLTDRYDALILKQARLEGLDARLVKSIVAAESEFSIRALSPRGARGLMQILPSTAEEVGVSRKLLWEPEANIRAGVAYLGYLYRTAWALHKLKGVDYVDAPAWLRQRIIASYNAGPRSLTNVSWRAETRGYVRKVLLYYESPVTELRGSHAARLKLLRVLRLVR